MGKEILGNIDNKFTNNFKKLSKKIYKHKPTKSDLRFAHSYVCSRPPILALTFTQLANWQSGNNNDDDDQVDE